MRYSGQLTLRSDKRLGHIALRFLGLLVLMLSATSSFGSDIDVFVVDRNGRPVADVAVHATRVDGKNQLQAQKARAVMDQAGKQFVPHLLVVQTGTPVGFPNSDTVAHHVYSFSHPNKFILPMYKGEQHPPVTFEHNGIVILGCNIHDSAARGDRAGHGPVLNSAQVGADAQSGRHFAISRKPCGQANALRRLPPYSRFRPP